MSAYLRAIKIIKTFEGFHEKAYADHVTGAGPYTIGYGTTFYPDGSPVKQGQCCTKKKAHEYLLSEITVINEELNKLRICLDLSMREALVSFIHSVGWDAFLYSEIIDHLEAGRYKSVVHELSRWVFDAENQVIGGLIERRREEAALFLEEINESPWSSTEILLSAFRVYQAAPNQVRAIRQLEEMINPYILSEFANNFHMEKDDWCGHPPDEYGLLLSDLE